MAYSLKFVLDTLLKQSTAQSNQLSEDQLQYIDAGVELHIIAIQPVDSSHLKVTFGRDAQGKQIFFKGQNTWYIYNPAVQVLRDGQPVVSINNPAQRPPQTSPSASIYVLKPVYDTWLKQATSDGSLLPDSQRQFLDAGTVLPISGYRSAPNNHLQVTLGKDRQAKQIFFKGRNTWYVYRPYVQILRDGKVILPEPVSTQPDSNGRRQINPKGVRLLKSFEGLRLTAYRDAVGVWTIGYGTTRGVRPGMRITESQAEALLRQDLRRFETAVSNLVKVAINEDQFSALVSFTYNVGERALGESTLLRVLNQRSYQTAANEFLRWNRAGGRELAGLTRRRQAERALFLGQDYTALL